MLIVHETLVEEDETVTLVEDAETLNCMP